MVNRPAEIIAHRLAPRTDWREMGEAEHFVQFYEGDSYLLDAVSGFLGTGLRAGDAAIVLATPSHREGIEERLLADGLDVAALSSSGAYASLDAAEMLSSIMVDGSPDPERVAANIGGLLERAAQGARPVRVFGELVALLCADGNPTAATRLEALWNDLQTRHRFALFCGYPSASFGASALADHHSEVCALHGRVIPAESYSELGTPDERLRAIARLQQKADSLETEMAARAEEADRLYRRAQDAIRMRDDFLIAASHDLKTPLTVVLGHTQSLRHRLAQRSETDDKTLEGLTRIERRARMMATVLDELVDATRLQAGHEISLDRERTDLVALARELVEAYDAGTSRHDLTLDTDEAELVGFWDQVRLTRVVGNLLNNAIKYSPNGGRITVQVSRDHDQDDQWALLSVHDHGLGIPHHELPHIFERFYRAENVLGKTSGTGIGLATARDIVEQHGGTITVTSSESEGTTFLVRLPCR